MHRAAFGIATALLLGCTSSLPDHHQFKGLYSQSEARQLFGDPDSIDRFNHGPDVPSQSDLRHSGLRVMHYERWVYASNNDKAASELGNTYIIFRMNEDQTEGFTEGITWIPAESR